MTTSISQQLAMIASGTDGHTRGLTPKLDSVGTDPDERFYMLGDLLLRPLAQAQVHHARAAGLLPGDAAGIRQDDPRSRALHQSEAGHDSLGGDGAAGGAGDEGAVRRRCRRRGTPRRSTSARTWPRRGHGPDLRRRLAGRARARRGPGLVPRPAPDYNCPTSTPRPPAPGL